MSVRLCVRVNKLSFTAVMWNCAFSWKSAKSRGVKLNCLAVECFFKLITDIEDVSS